MKYFSDECLEKVIAAAESIRLDVPPTSDDASGVTQKLWQTFLSWRANISDLKLAPDRNGAGRRSR